MRPICRGISGRAAARRRRMAISRPMPPWCWPSRRPEPARAGRADRRGAAQADPDVATAEVAGPGLRQPQARADALLAWRAGRASCGAGPDYGALDDRRRRKVNVEYVSANPTGPMHVGHCRGAVVGDALANLLAFAGYDGHQGILHQRRRRAGRRAGAARRCCATARRLAKTIGEIPAGLYPGDYLKPVGAGAGRRVRPEPAAAAGRRGARRSSRTAPSTP